MPMRLSRSTVGLSRLVKDSIEAWAMGLSRLVNNNIKAWTMGLSRHINNNVKAWPVATFLGVLTV